MFGFKSCQSSRRARGQSLVEFAIALPVLILLASGMLDLGRAYYFEILVNDAVRDGARVAIGNYAASSGGAAGPGNTLICTEIQNDLADVYGTSCNFVTHAPPYSAGSDYTAPSPNQAVAVVYCGSSSGCGATTGAARHYTAAVFVYYGFSLLTPGLNGIFGGSVQMSASSQMVTNW